MQTLIDFQDDDGIANIQRNEGVTIRRTNDNMLEVRVTPFSEHGNHWPLIAFGPEFFGQQVNVAHASSLQTALHHESEGMSRVDLQVSTSTDMTRDVDTHGLLIPGHTRMPVRMSIESILTNDPSDIAVIQFIFRPREIEMVFLVEPMRLAYEPAVGSPVDHMMKTAASLESAFGTVAGHAPQASATALARKIEALSADIAEARPYQFYRSHRALSQRIDAIVGEIGRLRFLDPLSQDAGELWIWEQDRYPNIMRRTGPDLSAQPLERIESSMAGNEFRDCVVMISAAEHDLLLEIVVRPVGDALLPVAAVTIRRTDYIKGIRKEATGDVLLPVESPLSLPAGESRQLWIRFDTRATIVPPGHYEFELMIRDQTGPIEHKCPGELTVWDFSLPDYDVLPNNSYAILGGRLGVGETYRQAVRHMKLYGLNHLFVEPPVVVRPTGLDHQWRITDYDDRVLMDQVTEAMEAWDNAPGTDTLHFIFSLDQFHELGLKREGYAFPNARWENVFAQWLGHFKSLMQQAGLDTDHWMLFLADESGEPALVNLEIPLAEAIKRIDPAVRIMCNASTILSDEHLSTRLFKAFDLFQPHLDYDLVHEWLRQSGKPLWVYQCQTDLPPMGIDLYSYYRVFAWQMLDRGFVGTGLWTYYSAAHDRPWDEDFQGCQMIYLHPEQGLVHSRRYEMAREGLDDYRYAIALRHAADAHSPEVRQEAQSLIDDAVQDILAHRQDRQRCETWRHRIAQRILSLRYICDSSRHVISATTACQRRPEKRDYLPLSASSKVIRPA
jgi:hypothetical protein